MSVRRFFGAAAASLLMLAGLMTSTPAAALQCVPFARAETGIEIYGNAKTWWAQAAGDYDRGQEPREGAVMAFAGTRGMPLRSEEHTSELQSLMRISYAVFCLKKKNKLRQRQSNESDINNIK